VKLAVTLTPEEKAEIRHRASSHGLSMSAYMRTAGLATFGAAADDPDVIWSKLSPSRKHQVVGWLFRTSRPTVPEGQGELFEQ